MWHLHDSANLRCNWQHGPYSSTSSSYLPFSGIPRRQGQRRSFQPRSRALSNIVKLHLNKRKRKKKVQGVLTQSPWAHGLSPKRHLPICVAQRIITYQKTWNPSYPNTSFTWVALSHRYLTKPQVFTSVNGNNTPTYWAEWLWSNNDSRHLKWNHSTLTTIQWSRYSRGGKKWGAQRCNTVSKDKKWEHKG